MAIPHQSTHQTIPFCKAHPLQKHATRQEKKTSCGYNLKKKRHNRVLTKTKTQKKKGTQATKYKVRIPEN